jgi:hypothetical protein
MPLTSRVTSILPEPNEDGDNVIGIKLGDGSAFDVAIDLGAAQKLVEILQRRLVRWASESAKSLSLPQYDVTDAAIAHRGPEVALILTTTQMGHQAFRMPNELVKKVHREIGRVVTYGFGSKAKN